MLPPKKYRTYTEYSKIYQGGVAAVLKLNVLPAGHGDCLWIDYGDPATPNAVIIDGGAVGTYKRALIPRIKAGGNRAELLVITHLDGDHITGVLDLLGSDQNKFNAKEIWFNGFRHLPSEILGYEQADRLTDILVGPGINWNGIFHKMYPADEGRIAIPDSGDLPCLKLAGGLSLTLLSPGLPQLVALRPA